MFVEEDENVEAFTGDDDVAVSPNALEETAPEDESF
jgi:hypothetical protein